MKRRTFLKAAVATAAAAVTSKFIWNPEPARLTFTPRAFLYQIDEKDIEKYLSNYRELGCTLIVTPLTSDVSFSPDGGQTWVVMGSEEARQIASGISWADQFEIGDAAA